MNHPKSATATLTGLAGLMGCALAIGGTLGSSLSPHLKGLVVLLATAAAMIAVDAGYFKTWRNLSTGLATDFLRPFSLERSAHKLTGFIVTLAMLAAIYWVLPEYRRDFYAPYWAALYFFLPFMLIAAPFYVAYVDRRQVDPEDAYAEIGAFILRGTAPQKTEQLRQHVLGWVVKGFFLPLMFVYLCQTLNSVQATLLRDADFTFMEWHVFATNLLYTVDLLIGAVGYVFTLRILDSHIRSVEPTVLGWLVCVMCYAPINQATSNYLNDNTGATWTTALSAWPALQVLWGSAILLGLVVYVWASVSFGLRFSNLTHRGIITSGPYRWMKHPAYVAKNLTWWLVSVPFLSAAGPGEALRHCLLLLGLNGLYALRAITEERHLARDPVYVAYQAYIAEHGAWTCLKRFIARQFRRTMRGDAL
jgi:hypothetical protein